ncbi:hypothetical protein ADK64_10975 [Streptomyces sp. MMG1121]|nr:hypothetical protein ADK64_10975 [Streptomyces sp. MMG1121]
MTRRGGSFDRNDTTATFTHTVTDVTAGNVVPVQLLWKAAGEGGTRQPSGSAAGLLRPPVRPGRARDRRRDRDSVTETRDPGGSFCPLRDDAAMLLLGCPHLAG